MIPKDILDNLYLKLFHAEIKKEVGPSAATGRTVRLLLADCPPGQRGPSAWLVGRRCSTGCSRSINGHSAPGVRTVRATRGLSAGVSWTVRPCRARVGPRPRGLKSKAGRLLSPSDPISFPSLFLASSQRKDLPLRDFAWGTLRTIRAHPRTLREVLHHVIRVFLRISHSISRVFEQRGRYGLDV
jgi:hypothetical protein